MRIRIDLSDQVFGKLKALSIAPNIITKAGDIRTAWNCICDCGNELEVKTNALRRKYRPKTQCKECQYKKHE